jgi:hypothetical protein
MESSTSSELVGSGTWEPIDESKVVKGTYQKECAECNSPGTQIHLLSKNVGTLKAYQEMQAVKILIKQNHSRLIKVAGFVGMITLSSFATGVAFVVLTQTHVWAPSPLITYGLIIVGTITGVITFIVYRVSDVLIIRSAFNTAFNQERGAHVALAAVSGRSRLGHIRDELTSKHADILCLQGQLSTKTVQKILPAHFDFIRCGTAGLDTTVAWDTRRFTIIFKPRMESPVEIPATIVLLKDAQLDKTFCVASALFRGFSVANIEEEGLGDNQLRYDLNTMEEAKADYCLIAGNYNVAEAHDRLGILESDYAYKAARILHGPTAYDRNLKTWSGIPMRVVLDHAYGKGREEGLTVSKIETIGTPEGEECGHCAILVTYSIGEAEDTDSSDVISDTESESD